MKPAIDGIYRALLLPLVLALPATAESEEGKHPWQLLHLQVGSNLAVMAGNHLNAAHENLANKDTGTARDELLKAGTILEIMEEQAAMPTARARIANAEGRLEYESPRNLETELVPLYAELGIITDERNNKQAKKHLRKAMKSLEKGNREGAREELRKIDKLIVFRRVSLPIETTRSHIDAAISAIHGKETAKAKEAVEAAQTSLRQDIVVTLDREGKRVGKGVTTPTAE